MHAFAHAARKYSKFALFLLYFGVFLSVSFCGVANRIFCNRSVQESRRRDEKNERACNGNAKQIPNDRHDDRRREKQRKRGADIADETARAVQR